MGYRTPLARVRGLGSAKEGADHFWQQRLTAVANIFLLAFLICLLVSGLVHMRLGMQTIIEDYVHSEGRKVAALMLNSFFTIAVGLVCVFAVLKLSFGA